MHNPGATLRQSLEHQWQRLPSIPVDDERVRKLIDRLEVEISALQAAGHTWVTERINRFGDKTNWSGYCMEVHFAAGLLSNEVNPRPAAKLLDGDDSDVDFVVRADPGIQVNFELVCIGEYLKARKLITDGAYAKLHQVYYRRHGEKNRPHGDKGTRDRNPAEHPISETTGELSRSIHQERRMSR